MNTNLFINLQLFAEEGASAAEAEGGQVAAVGEVSAPNGDMGANATPEGSASDNEVSEELKPYAEIRKLYGKDIDGEIRKAVEKRLKKVGRDSANLKKAERLIVRAFKKYGIAEGDYDGLEKAVAQDNGYYAELATQRGTSEEIERELDEKGWALRDAKTKLDEREREDERRRQFEEIDGKMKEVKELYPEFDLAAEMENPIFAQWASIPGVSFVDAYRTAHFEELMEKTSAAVASAATKKTVNSIKSGAKLPKENGLGGAAPADVRTDPSKYTREEIDDILRQASEGKKIRF